MRRKIKQRKRTEKNIIIRLFIAMIAIPLIAEAVLLFGMLLARVPERWYSDITRDTVFGMIPFGIVPIWILQNYFSLKEQLMRTAKKRSSRLILGSCKIGYQISLAVAVAVLIAFAILGLAKVLSRIPEEYYYLEVNPLTVGVSAIGLFWLITLVKIDRLFVAEK